MAEYLRGKPTVAMVAVAASLAVCALSPAHAVSFRVDELAPGVDLYRPVTDAAGGTNSLVVDREDGLLVVGAQPSPETARELLTAIAERTDKQVRYLVLPHIHTEALGGATAFPESTLVIGHPRCLEILQDPEYDIGAEARIRASDPASWKEPPRRLPVLTPYAKTVLNDPRNLVELLPLSASHSPGDLGVFLPRSDVFFVGATVFPDGRPYAADADDNSWIAALNHLIRQSPRLVVPMHGAAHDAAALRAQRDSLAWLRGKVNEGMIDRLPFDELVERVLEDEDLGERFDTSSPFLSLLVERVTNRAMGKATVWQERAKAIEEAMEKEP